MVSTHQRDLRWQTGVPTADQFFGPGRPIIVDINTGYIYTLRDDDTVVEIGSVSIPAVEWGDIIGTLSDQSDLNTALAAKAASVHTHVQGDVTGLTAALAGKASSSHNHAQSDVTNLTADLAGKAASVHTHAQSDVTNLVSDLAGKAAASHTHAQSDVTNLVSDLAAKADATHGHAISDTTGLQTALDGKAATSHTHIIGDTTGLQAALDGKSATSHNHNGTYEPAGAVATHAAASDPHTEYQKESEKGQANGYASLGADGKVPAAQLPASSGSDPFLAKLRLTADVTNATTTPANLTGMSFAFEANSTYVYELFMLATSAAATTGYGFDVDTSVAVTTVGLTFNHQLATTGTLSGGDSIADAASRGLSSGVPAINVTNHIIGSGVLVSGANAGTAQFRFRPEVAASATCKAGSVIRVMKIN